MDLWMMEAGLVKKDKERVSELLLEQRKYTGVR